MKRIFIALIGLTFILATGCEKENLEIEAQGIEMRPSLTLDIGQSFTLTATVVPDNVTHEVELVWHSSAPSVIDVDNSGNLRSLTSGSAVITVRIKDKPSIFAVCLVTVDEEVVVFDDDKFFALALYFDTNNDGKIQLSEASAVKELNVSGGSIGSLKGIEFFTGLEKLDCSINTLSTLDVSANLALQELLCFSNLIEVLDVSRLSELEVLDCHANRLSAIDITGNPELVSFNCGMNNGGMSNHRGIREVDVTNNPKLEIIDVYYTNLSELDVTQNPKLKHLNIGHSCHTNWDLTPIEKIDLSRNPDLEYFNCMSSNVRNSDIPNGYDFDFGMDEVDVTSNPKLKYLITYGNPKVKEIDLSRNPMLKHVNVSWNDLSELDITQCPLIDTLSCHWNKIATFDLTQSIELIYLDCANNQIGELDFSNTKLGYLLANDNKIATINMGEKTFNTIKNPMGGSGTSSTDNQPYLYMKLNDNLIEEIDLSKQTYLHWLEISDNRLMKLDVSACEKLGGLHCANNYLTELNIEGCTRLWELRCEGNQLTGTLDVSHTGGDRVISKLAAENNDLTYIKVQNGFNPASTSWVVDHTSGFSGSAPNYTKDTHTKWITTDGQEI